jgi:hypothetical protein
VNKCDWLHFSISMFLHVESRYFRFFARAQPTAHKSPKSSLCPTRGELLGPFSLSASARRTFLKLSAGRAYTKDGERDKRRLLAHTHTHTHTGVARVALIFPLSVHPLSLSAPCPAIPSGRSHSFTERDHRRSVRFRFRPA